jgi:hypothetical protein
MILLITVMKNHTKFNGGNMRKRLGKDDYPFDGENFGVSEEMQQFEKLSIDEQLDVINVAKENNSKHGAMVQMFIESLSHLWSYQEYNNLLDQLVRLWYEGDCVYRKTKPYSSVGMLEMQREMIIKYYSPPELLSDRMNLLSLHNQTS